MNKSEAEFRTIIDAIPTQVWCALPDGRPDFQNRTWLDYTGMSPDQTQGTGWHVAIHPDDIEAYASWWDRTWRMQIPSDAEARFRRHDGVFRWFLTRVVPLRDEQGNITKWYGTNTDIEELKRAEDALRASEQVARGQVEALVHNLDVLATSPAPDQFIMQMLITIERLLDAQWVALWLLDAVRDSIILRAAVKGAGPDPADKEHPFTKNPKAWKQDVSLEELFFTGAPFVCEDIESDMRVPAAIRDYFKAQGTTKFLRLPALAGGEVKGFITIRHAARPPYRATEIELAQALAHQTMLAIQTGQAATLEERNRMARDIHDTLAQGFTAVIIQLAAAEDAKTRGLHGELDQHLQSARELARNSLMEARRSVQALRPQALEDAPFWEALKRLIKQTTNGTPLQTTFRRTGQPYELRPFWQEQLLHIGQEALTNTLKHARASRFETRLSFDEHDVSLEFKDNGAGFQLDEPHDGSGLRGMRERVQRIGATLDVRSGIGEGTTIRVVLPASLNGST